MTDNPDKGQADGSCNRSACQAPLKDEPVHQFMSGIFTGGPRLHYCAACAADFDAWDKQSGDAVRIQREKKERARPFTQDIDRDARLVMVAMKHGPAALCSQAMLLGPEFAGGPDRLVEHGNWLRSDPDYKQRVIDRCVELEQKT